MGFAGTRGGPWVLVRDLTLFLTLRPCFIAPSFRTFCALAAGLAGQPRRRTVCGMLLTRSSPPTPQETQAVLAAWHAAAA
jgi:hypothetical protein